MPPRIPQKPKPPAALELATLEQHDLADEAAYAQLDFTDLDLSGRTATELDFTQCRFTRTVLSRSVLARANLADCLIERSDLANLRAERSTMARVAIAGSRLTGLHWIDGHLRDVFVTDSRLDLSVYRATKFREVRFEVCNLARADFTDADLTGATFVGCDLTAAQFSHANMRGARLTDCTLDGVGGVTSFDGATISTSDLLGLSRTLATALGITVES